jgi:hypothetical protein
LRNWLAATLLLAGANAHAFGENCPDIPGNITLNSTAWK